MKFTFEINEATFAKGKTATIDFLVDRKPVTVTVPTELKAYFTEQFCRPNPTANQRRRYTTLMRLLGAAYTKGVQDGEATPKV